MKKLSLLLFLLFSAYYLHGQSISPYAPKPYVSATDNPYETQMTYFDLNFVGKKIEAFLNKQFQMSLTKSDSDINEGKGITTQKFTSSTDKSEELSFAYSVQAVENELLITEVKITGSAPQVTKFYSTYWTNTSDPGNASGNAIFNGILLQDAIAYHYNSGKPYIEIKNTTIPDADTFLTEMKAKEAAWKEESNEELANIAEEQRTKQKKEDEARESRAASIRAERAEEVAKRAREAESAKQREASRAEKLKQEEARATERKEALQKEREQRNQQLEERRVKEAEARKQKEARADTLRNTFQRRLFFNVVKNNKEVVVNKKPGIGSRESYRTTKALKDQLTEFMKDRKPGIYVISAQYKKVYSDVQELKFQVREFTKPDSSPTEKTGNSGT